MESKDIELEVPPEDQQESLQDPPPEKARQEGEEEGEDEFDFGPAVYDENLYGGFMRLGYFVFSNQFYED